MLTKIVIIFLTTSCNYKNLNFLSFYNFYLNLCTSWFSKLNSVSVILNWGEITFKILFFNYYFTTVKNCCGFFFYLSLLFFYFFHKKKVCSDIKVKVFLSIRKQTVFLSKFVIFHTQALLNYCLFNCYRKVPK